MKQIRLNYKESGKQTRTTEIKKQLESCFFDSFLTKVYRDSGGTDGNRTRDLLRDRQAF